VQAQTVPNWELWVMDDASTDNTAALVQSLAAQDTRIKYQRLEPVGHPAGVRNAGLRLAQGDLIAFLDADDAYLPDALENLSRVLVQNPTQNGVFGFPQEMDEHANSLTPSVQLMPDGEGGFVLPANYRHSWDAIVKAHLVCMLPALMIRKTLLDRVGLFNEALKGPEDFEFYLRLYLQDFNAITCLPRYIYRYRIHAASLTKAPEHVETILNSNLRIMNWLFEQPGLPAHLKSQRSVGITMAYRYMGRERLLHGQPMLARRLAQDCFKNPDVRFVDALLHCGPIWLRSFLPRRLDTRLVSFRRGVRFWSQQSHLT
jgi:glycosyltransferase involved in cell wall biosynthesis